MSKQVITRIAINSGPRNRQTVFFRGILVAPVMIFLSAFGTQSSWDSLMRISSGLMVYPVLLALLFRGKYPSYLLAFNKALMELSVRAFAYFFLLTDEYPSIEASQIVSVEFPDVEGGKALNQFAPLFKWILAIPLYIFGLFYILYTLFVTFFAWIITSATGEYPEWAAGPVYATIAYWNRVYGYALILVTDEYPSFSLMN